MTINLSLGWWIAPALITAAVFIWAFIACSDSRGGYGADIAGMMVYGVAIIVSLFVWLVWAVLA